jgi:hypothetical protein
MAIGEREKCRRLRASLRDEDVVMWRRAEITYGSGRSPNADLATDASDSKNLGGHCTLSIILLLHSF